MPDTADFYSSGFVIDIDLLASVRWYLMQFIIATTLHLYGQSYSGYINGYQTIKAAALTGRERERSESH